MFSIRCVRSAPVIGVLTLSAAFCGFAGAQGNPYSEVADWIESPEDREMGSVSWAYSDAEGNIWIAERCGQNSCVDRDDLSPIHVYDRSGRWIRGFGKGLFVWPHGLYVDADGNVWVTDARGDGRRGHQVIKFSSQGEVLMALGEAGVAGNGPGQFNGPTDVVVAPNGDIFVSDGHSPDSNNRVLKFSRDGTFLQSWGGSGSDPGEFSVPHAIAMDSRGRLFVADRGNNRVQVFDQEGGFLEEWTQFGRATGLFIGADDTIYVSDNQSNAETNPGWQRGIWVGSAGDGSVAAFLPDPDFDPSVAPATGAHGVTANAMGEIFGAEVGARTVRKYIMR
jgi:sugar lactone lactonase YvrE